MLFLDTCEVKAFNTTTYAPGSLSWSYTLYPDSYNSHDEVYGTVNSGTGSIRTFASTNSTYSYEFEYVLPIRFPAGITNSSDFYDTLRCAIYMGGISVNHGSVLDCAIYMPDGTAIYQVPFASYINKYFTCSAIVDVNTNVCTLPLVIKGHIGDTSASSSDRTYTLTLDSPVVQLSTATQFESDVSKIQVSDSQLNTQMTQLNTSTQAIEQSVTSDSGGGILATIKNFFGGFFTNLFNSILSLFVPSSDYFTTWFTNVNALLSDKLGMLYAPLDLLISTLNAVYSASSDFSGIPFPEIKWGDTVLVSAQNLTFSNLLGEHFEDIQGYVYFGTDVVLLFAFLMLLQRKITLVLRGHESG